MQEKSCALGGFTLMETLVVVIIIAILTAVAVPWYKKLVEKSYSAEALALFKSVAAAQEAYYASHDKYADKFADLDVDVPWTGNTKITWRDASDVRSNERWSIAITTSYLPIMTIFRTDGKYKESGFIFYLQTGQAAEPLRHIYCAERAGVTSNQYCADVMKATENVGLDHYVRYNGFKMEGY